MLCALLWTALTACHLGAETPRAPMEIDRGPDQIALHIPASEELVFSVAVDLGRLGKMRLGTVTLTAEHGVEPGPLPLPGGEPSGPVRYARIQSRATGSYVGYRLDHSLTTRYLPDQEWPRVLHSDVQAGTENRRRELRLGLREASSSARYRSDHHCGGCTRKEHEVESYYPWGSDHHCERCRRGEHRCWKDSVDRPTPPGTLDILSSLYLARALVASNLDEVSFPMLDKLELWIVRLSLGRRVRQETAAGKFDCREVLLETSVPDGEAREEDPQFAGLFGIKGELRIFVEESSGIPVWIEGTVPAGPVDLDVIVRLESQAGASGN